MEKKYFLTSDWRRSTRCESVACVEVARQDHDVAMRDSNDPGAHLRFSSDAWNGFLTDVREGRFDRS